MSLLDRINEEMKNAMKVKAKDKLTALRSIKSALLLARTEKGAEEGISEEKEMSILNKLAKQRKDAISIFEEQNRSDLADIEKLELVVIEQFLPAQMDESDVREIIGAIVQSTGASGMKDMGRIMKEAMHELTGKADGKLISDITKELLSE